MKIKIYSLILFSLIMLSTSTLFAQREYYKSQSGFDIGLGFGVSNQKSDIRNSVGGAGTIFIGHSIYQQPGAFFGLDWRLRFLGGRNMAFDDRRTVDSSYNNIRYTHYNYDLEFELSLNSLSEKTGIVISGFGGAGITQNLTAKNLLNNSDPYDYNSINSDGNDNRFKIYRDLRKLADKSFETDGINNFCLSPTLGFYIGYQLTPHFTMGIEHKVNYFYDEAKSDIDGVQVTDSKIDRNRYTGLSLRWDIPHESVNPFAPCEKPVVNFNVVRASSGKYSHQLNGSVLNVQSQANISISVDGNPDQYFTYMPGTNNISLGYILSPGAHIFKVTASTKCGSDTETVQVIVEEPCVAPVVKISMYEPTSLGGSYRIEGQILNCTGADQILLVVNGTSFTGFNYDVKSGKFVSTHNLSKGSHSLSVNARNECGQDSESLQITVGEPCIAPVISFSLVPNTYNNNTHELSGRIENVASESDIVVTVDGVRNYNFRFVAGANQISAMYKFGAGTHTVIVSAKNECGDDTESAKVTVGVPCVPPTIKITVNETNKASFTHELLGTVSNIENNSGITINVDGIRDDNFKFVNSNGRLSSMYNLKAGKHKIIVTAKNECGESTQTIEVTVKAPCEKPVIKVSVSDIKTSGKIDGSFTHTISGAVTNVKSKNEITVKVDGVVDNSFTYNSSTSQLSGKFKLAAGGHKISVTAKNECGESTQTIEVTVKAPCEKPVIKVSVSDIKTSGKIDGSFTHTISGAVTNVKSKNEITVKVDGVVDNSFTYNSSTSQLSGKFKLAAGGHKISVTAKNECGESTQTIEVTVKAPCEKPVIKVSVSDIKTSGKIDGSFTHTISGAVTNVKSKNEITVKVDGVVDNSFTYNSSTSQLSGKFKLAAGGHKISVTAKNECGESTQTIEVTVKAPCEKPVIKVSVSDIKTSGKIDGSFTHTISGAVTNVKSKNEITVKVDGVVDNSFTYNSSTSQLSGKFKLAAGGHKISVTAKNECGESTQTIEVTVKAPCEKPVIKVSVNEKRDGAFTHNMSGVVTNVKSKNEITVKVDGVVDNSFTYNSSTSQLSGKFKLAAGGHKISVTAKNECGESTQTIEVTVKAPCEKPVIKVSVNEKRDGAFTHNMSGVVTNVKSKNEITVKVDGVVDNSFTYNSSTSQLSGKFKLAAGGHKISVTAKNECGESTQTIEVTVKAPCEKPVIKVSVNEKRDGAFTHNMSGVVTNVKSKNEITVKVDGVVDNSFTYNSSTSQLSGKFKLAAGGHKISVTAKNECGTDTQDIVITVKSVKGTTPVKMDNNAPIERN